MDAEQVLKGWLTTEQYAAAVAPEAEVLALAGAGAGKSRTLAGRVAHKVAAGSPPESIVAFTFSEKAAEQIKTRVAQALEVCGLDPVLVGGMYIGTIHAWCRRVLGEMDARYRQFDVLDEIQFLVYLISRYPRLNINPLRDERLTARGGRRPYFETLRQLSRAWHTMNDELLDPAQVATEDPSLGESLERLRMQLEQDNFIDFSLMQRLVIEALEARSPDAAQALVALKHVLVDEYQDVNVVHERLIALMHQHSETLFVVGDDDQAIYGRGPERGGPGRSSRGPRASQGGRGSPGGAGERSVPGSSAFPGGSGCSPAARRSGLSSRASGGVVGTRRGPVRRTVDTGRWSGAGCGVSLG